MSKMGRGACCCEQILEALGAVEILNQFEGLVIHPLCDDTTGEIVGYMSIVRNETDPPTYDTQYFDDQGNPIGAAPVDSSVCKIPVHDFEVKKLCYFDDPLYTHFLRKYVIDADGNVSRVDTRLDGETPYTVVDEINVYECPDITSEIVCYQVFEETTARNANLIFIEDGALSSTSDPFGATVLTIETERPQTNVGGVLLRVDGEQAAPTTQRITFKFSRPVTDFSFVTQLVNIPGVFRSRFHSFSVFPTDAGGVGDIDIGNKVSAEPLTATANGTLEWNGIAVTEISFTHEVYEYFTGNPAIDIEQISFTETTGDVVVKKAKCISDSTGAIRWVDIETGLNLIGPDVPTRFVECQPTADQVELGTGYIIRCDEFENSLPITSDGQFNDTPVDENTITFNDVNIADLIRGEIEKAQLLETEQEKAGLTITPFILNTRSGDVYSFNPSALAVGTGGLLRIDEAGVIAWGANQTDLVTTIEYSTLDGCECESVEVLQRITPDGRVFLEDVLDLQNYSTETGLKASLLTGEGDFRLQFGTRGPFPGPCPDDIQVLDLNRLCCNDDLTTELDVANQRLAWLDGADVSLMFNGGIQIPGDDGDIVDEIRDKLEPGIAESVVVPNSVGVDTGAGGPTLRTDALNGLSVLEFDGVNDRLRLDTDNPAGGSFAFFALVAKGNAPIGVDTVLAVGTGADGQDLNAAVSNWQINSDFGIGNENLVVSFRTPLGENIDPDLIEGTWPDVPTDGIGAGGTHRNLSGNIADAADFFDGQFHLITVTYSNTSMLLSVYMDGDRRLIADFTPTPQLAATLQSDYFRFFGNRNGADFSVGRLAEMIYFDTDLEANQISTVNAYLICKWGIDPSLAAGGVGDLTLNRTAIYSSPTPFVEIFRADGTLVYKNTLNGQEYPLPPLPSLSICDDPDNCPDCFTWDRQLCDRRDTVVELNLFQFDTDTEEVFRINGLTGAVLDTHTPTGVNWTHGTIYDTDNDFLYLFDTNNNQWHRYNANDLAAGNTPITLTGDAMTGNLTFAAYDPSTGLAYAGLGQVNRFRIDFNALTSLELAAISGLDTSDGYSETSSLSIDDNGIHYATNYLAPSQGVRIHTINPLTGAATRIGAELDIQLNGSDYDHAGGSGWYGVDSNLERIFRWTLPDMSDIQDIGEAFNPGGSLAVGTTEVLSTYVPFQRIFHKKNGVITTQDHNQNGGEFIVIGVPVICPETDATDRSDTLRLNAGVVNGPAGDFTIPEGTVSYSIAIETGVADIDGINRPEGWVLNQYPAMHGDRVLLYPQVRIQNATGRIHVVYNRLSD